MRSLVEGRGACTDAERRAALALHDELRARGHEAWVETVWVRPQWAAALALGSLLAVVGSLVSVVAPVPGLVAAALGAVTMVVRPFPRRATQDVLTAVPDEGVVLVIAAAYDVPRRNVRPWLRGSWAVGCALVIVAATVARVAGYEPGWLGAVQLVPTIALMIVFAAAADAALSSWAAGDTTPATAAITLFDELTRDPPRELRPALLLVGAGHALPRTARRLRAEGLRAERAVVLTLVSGELGWAARHSQLRAAAERATAALGLDPPAKSLRPTRLPTLQIGADNDRALDLALGVVDALDAELSARAPAARPRA